jgi:hypothetical protein
VQAYQYLALHIFETSRLYECLAASGWTIDTASYCGSFVAVLVPSAVELWILAMDTAWELSHWHKRSYKPISFSWPFKSMLCMEIGNFFRVLGFLELVAILALFIVIELEISGPVWSALAAAPDGYPNKFSYVQWIHMTSQRQQVVSVRFGRRLSFQFLFRCTVVILWLAYSLRELNTIYLRTTTEKLKLTQHTGNVTFTVLVAFVDWFIFLQSCRCCMVLLLHCDGIVVAVDGPLVRAGSSSDDELLKH